MNGVPQCRHGWAYLAAELFGDLSKPSLSDLSEVHNATGRTVSPVRSSLQAHDGRFPHVGHGGISTGVHDVRPLQMCDQRPEHTTGCSSECLLELAISGDIEQ